MTDSGGDLPRLAIICPVFNEAEAVPLFFARIQPVMSELSAKYAVRLIFLNNCSSDQTVDELQRLRAEDGRVQVISLSANVGYQRSLETGLRTLDADLYVMIDVDCEDPPEMIPRFLEEQEARVRRRVRRTHRPPRAVGAQGRPPALLPDVARAGG